MISDEGGQEVPYSKLGSSLFQGLDHGQHAFVTLTAGSMRSWRHNLADAFEALKPGKYWPTLEARVNCQTLRDKESPKEVWFVAKEIAFSVGE